MHTRSGVDTTVEDEDSLLDLKTRLDAEEFHVGREATTLALAPIGGGAGTTFPVLCLATCRASCPELGTKIFRMVRYVLVEMTMNRVIPYLIAFHHGR